MSKPEPDSSEQRCVMLNGVLFIGRPIERGPAPTDADALLTALCWPEDAEVWADLRLAVTDGPSAPVAVWSTKKALHRRAVREP